MNLTICIVTANREKEFKIALESVKNLNIKNYRTIVADDSKTSRSKRQVDKILPSAKYLRNTPPLREIKNTNKCIRLSKTQYVCLFHDDDIFDPAYFDQMIKIIEMHKDIDLAYTGRIMIDPDANEIARQIVNSEREYFIYKSKSILDHMLLGQKIENYSVPINTPGLVFKKELFDKIGGFDSNIDTHCDTDFLLKALALSNKVLYINKPYFLNRIWYGLSGRTKASEQGDVFFSEKSVLDNFLIFCQQRSIKRYLELKNKIYEKFSKDCISINGPFGWIALRFTGNNIDKLKKLITTAQEIVKLNKKVLIFPKFYFVFILSLIIPKILTSVIHKMLLKAYLNKK